MVYSYEAEFLPVKTHLITKSLSTKVQTNKQQHPMTNYENRACGVVGIIMGIASYTAQSCDVILAKLLLNLRICWWQTELQTTVVI